MNIGDQFVITKVPDVIYTIVSDSLSSDSCIAQLPSGDKVQIRREYLQAAITNKHILVIYNDDVIPLPKKDKPTNYFSFDDI
jgi:hypothetical protein